MPITCDSGADITVVPDECVRQDQFTGGTCEVDSFNKVRSSGKRYVKGTNKGTLKVRRKCGGTVKVRFARSY